MPTVRALVYGVCFGAGRIWVQGTRVTAVALTPAFPLFGLILALSLGLVRLDEVRQVGESRRLRSLFAEPHNFGFKFGDPLVQRADDLAQFGVDCQELLDSRLFGKRHANRFDTVSRLDSSILRLFCDYFAAIFPTFP